MIAARHRPASSLYSPMRPFLLVSTALCQLAAACGTSEGPIDESAEAMPLPGGSGGISFDDLRWSPALGRIIAPGSDTGVHLVDPDSMSVETLAAGGPPIESADGGDRLVFALHRDDATVEVFDAATGDSLATAPLTASPDYLRYLPGRRELWVTEPGAGRIEILAIPADGPPDPVPAGEVDVGGGPEGLAIDEEHGLAYAHRFNGELVAIDLADRSVSTFETGCDGAHGIPAVDPDRRLVFAGCRNAEVVVLDADDGRVKDRRPLDGGATILAYAPALGHFYLRGDPGQTVATLGVADDGGLELLGEIQAGLTGHCAQADESGHLWVCDAARGQLLRFPDPYPPAVGGDRP
jgi:hypothetical protein